LLASRPVGGAAVVWRHDGRIIAVTVFAGFPPAPGYRVLRCGVSRGVRCGTAVCGHGAAVRQDLTVVLEDNDAVAQKAPSLLREAGNDASGVVVGGISRGAGRLVRAHRKLSGVGLNVDQWCLHRSNAAPGRLVTIPNGTPARTAGAARPVLRWRSPRPCVVTHMTKHARYPAERRSFEHVTGYFAKNRPFG